MDMEYRPFGKLGFDISRFGVGCMRLPTVAATGEIDEARAIAMLRHAIDSGVNYFDTAYPYHGGKSELLVAKALADGYRDRVKLATKLPSWLIEKTEDFDRLLDEQLKKLGTDHIDFYLLHGLDAERWPKLVSLGALSFLDRAVKDGRIRYPGFSFHDDFPAFRTIIDAYDWKMCQIQLNILDEFNQAGVEGLKYAGAKGIPVVVMEPLRGGNLAQNIPPEAQAIWDEKPLAHGAVEWAFRWLYNFPEVAVILSGVSNMEQLDANLEIFAGSAPGVMTQEDFDRVRRVRQVYEDRIRVGCTGCEYCMPCPSGVSIPRIFHLYNDASVFGRLEGARAELARMESEGKGPSACVACGHCESVCPQHLHVIDKLREAAGALK